MFIGREKELTLLQQDYIGKAVMVYGKRRVGKTTLIQKALENCQHSVLDVLSFCRGSPYSPPRGSCSRSQPCPHRSERNTEVTAYYMVSGYRVRLSLKALFPHIIAI